MVGGHDDHFLIIDRAGTDYVLAVRSHTGEVLSIYLRSDDIVEMMNFLTDKPKPG